MKIREQQVGNTVEVKRDSVHLAGDTSKADATRGPWEVNHDHVNEPRQRNPESLEMVKQSDHS